MCIFNSISTFRDAIHGLCKKEGWLYTSCKKDVCDLFLDRTFADIWQMGFKIKDENDIRVIKFKFPNSLQNISSSEGFRLFACCNRKIKMVTFFYIYPKRGKKAQMDQTPTEIKRQLGIYLKEFTEKTLVEHRILNELEEVLN